LFLYKWDELKERKKMKSESRILFEYPDYQVEIEWNGSATFNVFNGGKNVNCFTDYSAKTMEQAQKSADEWLEEQLEEEKLRNADSN
tara:strand:+ start:346 stop:606 length:261 start_codon:yes stop_codon:yes gene_type:complete